MILIQHIETIWTKRSRGMPGAAKRNAVPRVLVVAATDASTDAIFLHKVACKEGNGFAPEQQTEVIDSPKQYWSLAFDDENGFLVGSFTYDLHKHGQPSRHHSRTRIFKLREGEYGALHINGRHTYYSGQFYTQHVVNVAFLNAFDSEVFLKEPDMCVNLMANLF